MVTTPAVWKSLHQANLSDAGNQTDPAIVDVGGGRYVVVWTEAGGGPIGVDSGANIIGQIFNAEGGRIGSEFQLDSIDTGGVDARNPSLASRPGGGFVVAFENTNAAGTAIRAHAYDAAGNFVGGTQIAGDPGGNDLIENPSIGMRPNGAYLVAYEYYDDSSTTTNIVGRIVDANGNVGGEIGILELMSTSQGPDTAALSNGNYVVVFEHETAAADHNPQFRIVNANGTLGAYVNLSLGGADQTDVHVAALHGGGFVAVWTQENGDGSGQGIRARIFDNNGLAQSSAFTVNGSTVGEQRSPDVVATPDGFIVTWKSDALGIVAARRFDADGNPLSTDFVAGSEGSEQNPAIALLRDGRFVVGFEQVGGPEPDVWATIHDPREAVISGTGGADVITSRIAGATVSGQAGNDTLLGQGVADVLNGGAGNDRLHGRAGNDVLNGGTGADDMRGGPGNDTYVVDGASDQVIEASSQGTDLVRSSVSFTLAANIEHLTLIGSGNINGTGNGLGNVITGNAGANILGGGNGNDTYVVGPGDRVVEGSGQGSDAVRSSASFTLGDHVENLMLTGSGNIDGKGNALANLVAGNAAANVLKGGKGNDTLYGRLGDDALKGGKGNDLLSGDAGKDTLVGSKGKDILAGGVGKDELKGGKGKDQFFFADLGKVNKDKVKDFKPGPDKLCLDQDVFPALNGGLNRQEFDKGGQADDDNDHLIYEQGKGRLYYDPDGEGGADQVLFAKLGKGTRLDHKDFDVVVNLLL